MSRDLRATRRRRRGRMNSTEGGAEAAGRLHVLVRLDPLGHHLGPGALGLRPHGVDDLRQLVRSRALPAGPRERAS